MIKNSRFTALLILAAATCIGGCKDSQPSTTKDAAPPKNTDPATASNQTAEDATAPAPPDPVEPVLLELDAKTLLAARLSPEEASEGWIRLFDNTSLYGLQMAGSTKWQVTDGTLVTNDDQRGLLCTTSKWLDFELSLEYKASETTNSGIFLRTPLFPIDPEEDCYELNIAPPNNPFPTASLVKRLRTEPSDIGEIANESWQRYDIRVEGGRITVKLNGKEVLEYEDSTPLPAGYIGFQYNEGPIAFRDIRLKPLGLESQLSETVEDNWVRYPEMEGDFQMSDDGLHITGGRGQLESKAEFGNFVLHTEVRTNANDLNGGIFFRCIKGEQMMGYECQICNAIKNDDALFPGDCGTGGFFRRQDARVVAANDKEWFSMLVVVDGPTMSSWVNGLQVSEWTDTREVNDNPRKGLRLSPGTLMLQAHDPTTDIHIRQLSVATLDNPSVPDTIEPSENAAPSTDDSKTPKDE